MLQIFATELSKCSDPQVADSLGQEEKHKKWVLALHQELIEVFREFGLKLPRPAILLHTSESHWGRWDPLGQSISISIPLIEQSSWRVVVEIFKHEIAHQMVSSLYQGSVRPHGKEFRDICKLLRIEKWAHGATCEKPLKELQDDSQWKNDHASLQRQKQNLRIQKLLALANSTNEHEAMLAMSRVRELQEKNNITLVGSAPPDNWVHLEISSKKSRHAPYESQIASLLMTHFQVDIVFMTRFCAIRCKTEAMIDMMGRRENVLLAEYVHSFLHQSSEALWQKERKRGLSKGLRAKHSFIRGLLAGFHKKLDIEKKEKNYKNRTDEHRKSNALVIDDAGRRQEYVRTRYPRLSKRKSSARIDLSAFQQGRSEGQKLKIKTAISKSRNIGAKYLSA